MMKKLLITAIAASFTLGYASVSFADNPNWSDEKKAQVEQNRNSDSGLGNGGESSSGNSIKSETSRRDVDPGNSGNQCQGGKNKSKKC